LIDGELAASEEDQKIRPRYILSNRGDENLLNIEFLGSTGWILG
jgi:hypothetical protein